MALSTLVLSTERFLLALWQGVYRRHGGPCNDAFHVQKHSQMFFKFHICGAWCLAIPRWRKCVFSRQVVWLPFQSAELHGSPCAACFFQLIGVSSCTRWSSQQFWTDRVHHLTIHILVESVPLRSVAHAVKPSPMHPGQQWPSEEISFVVFVGFPSLVSASLFNCGA